MPSTWKDKILFLSAFALFILSLSLLNRMFFKQNSGFCVAFLYSRLESNPDWEIMLPKLEEDAIKEALDQKFYYLAKGCHCYAFISEDQKYVIKFHRYASHLRLFSWAYHPFSYLFDERRKKIKEHNMQRLKTNLQSYKDCYCELKEEAGLLLMHINRSENLHKSITIIDKMKSEYRISLDDVTFILQRKADPIFSKLDQLIKEDKIDEAKKMISSILQLIITDSQKGFIDKDPVLRRNYGWVDNRAIHIDVGDLVKCEEMRLRQNYLPHVKAITQGLRLKIEHCPALLEYYEREIQAYETH